MDNAPGSGAGCAAVGEELDELRPALAVVRTSSGVPVVIRRRSVQSNPLDPVRCRSKPTNQPTNQSINRESPTTRLPRARPETNEDPTEPRPNPNSDLKTDDDRSDDFATNPSPPAPRPRARETLPTRRRRIESTRARNVSTNTQTGLWRITERYRARIVSVFRPVYPSRRSRVQKKISSRGIEERFGARVFWTIKSVRALFTRT